MTRKDLPRHYSKGSNNISLEPSTDSTSYCDYRLSSQDEANTNTASRKSSK
jgi:hypothetical protein